MFNTLKYAKQLEATGLNREQAEAFIESLTEIMTEHFATKEHINELRIEFKEEFTTVKEDIAQLGHKIDLAVHKLTIKLGSLLAIGLGVMSFIVKFSN